MSQDELNELKAMVGEVAMQDVHLGRVLTMIVVHLAAAHGLDATAAPVEAAPVEAPTEAAPEAAPAQELQA